MTAAESLREKLDKAVEKSRGVLISWELSSSLLADLEAAERVVEEKTRLTYAMEERVRELTQSFEEIISITDRNHPVWDRAKAAIAKAKTS